MDYKYKGYDIYEAQHPMLFGKYEIFINETFIKRALNLFESKNIINTHLKLKYKKKPWNKKSKK